MAKIVTLEKTWLGGEVFILGGGKSLESFDWEVVRSELTIGCNDAYLLGSEICSIVVFGDNKWWKVHKDRLEKFKGRVFTNCNYLQTSTIPWVNVMARYQWGVSNKGLGWNSNTGAAAIDLALKLGAKKVFLLGFDCHLTEGENNWHENKLDVPNAAIYPRFSEGFQKLNKAIKIEYPTVDVVNVSDVSSLEVFDKVPLTGFFEKRNHG